jgi:hypothetical protein
LPITLVTVDDCEVRAAADGDEEEIVSVDWVWHDENIIWKYFKNY